MIDITGYEGLYAIDENGNVWGYKKKHFLTQTPDKDGYMTVKLTKNNVGKRCKVHRLVAQTFLPNPNNLPCVNHKDEDKANNNINNLEWCSIGYNVNYGTRNLKISKAVYCVELDRTFDSMTEAAKELGLDRSHIGACCNGKQHTCGGYHWRLLI